MSLKKIILVFKTHFDIGFTDLSRNVIENYGNGMLRQVIETCAATEQLGKLRYVWTMPAWPLWHIVHHCAPELKGELNRFIRNGQIVWHALPFTSHTDFCTPYEVYTGLKYSELLAEEYGLPKPVSAKMTDVPGHGMMLPDVLNAGGVRFLHLGCNEFSTPPQVPSIFFWEGAGGGRVLTMYSAGGYGTGLFPPDNWEYPVWMALMHTQDNCGPQSADKILEMAKEAAERYPDAEIVCGTMDDFYREIMQSDLNALPVVRKDLADTWIHGVGSYPKEIAQIRTLREKAVRLHQERLNRFISGKPEDAHVQTLWDEYEEQSALFSEHTWGADVKTFLGADRAYEKQAFIRSLENDKCRFMEASWQEQRDRATQAEKIIGELETLIPVKKTKEKRQDSLLHTETVGELVIVSNQRFRMTFDKQSGEIASVFDLELGDNLLRRTKDEPVFAYRYDKYGINDINDFLRAFGYRFLTWGIQDYGRENYPVCEHETFLPVFDGYEILGDSVVFTYHTEKSAEKYGDGERVRLTVTLPCDEDAIHVTLELLNKQKTPFVESGSLLLPLSFNDGILIGKPGAVIDPECDIAKNANHALYNLEHAVLVKGPVLDTEICSLDAPLFALGTPGVYEFKPDFVKPDTNTVYMNLFNNMWGTNFPQWTGGSLCWRFVIKGFKRAQEKDLHLIASAQAQAALGYEASPDVLHPGLSVVRTWKTEQGLRVLTQDQTGIGETVSLRVPNCLIREKDQGTDYAESILVDKKPLGLICLELIRKEEMQ